MASRVSFNEISTRILDRIFSNYSKLESIQTQLATGKKIDKASDNPVGASQSMSLRTEIDQYKSFQRNVDDGQAYLGTVDSTLRTSTDIYQNMRERAIQASNDTNSGESRYYIGQEVRGMFDQMVALSNTSFKGEYVFSGNNTQVPPYEIRNGSSHIINAPAVPSGDMALTGALIGTPIQIIDKNVTDSKDMPTSNANAYQVIPGTVKVNGFTEGKDYNVDYVAGTITFIAPGAAALGVTGAGPGIDMSFNWLRRNEKDLDGIANREIEEGVGARINTTASEIYGTNQEKNAWGAMIKLMEGTYNNKPDKVRDSIGELDIAMKRQLSAQSTNGSRVIRFESTQLRNDERIVYTNELQSNVEDVDFAQAITEFNTQQAVYDASLKIGARAMQNTLVNFL